jgi:hypothetical protein
VERALTVQEEEALRERMLTRLGHPFEINFRYVDQIARKAGGGIQRVQIGAMIQAPPS